MRVREKENEKYKWRISHKRTHTHTHCTAVKRLTMRCQNFGKNMNTCRIYDRHGEW